MLGYIDIGGNFMEGGNREDGNLPLVGGFCSSSGDCSMETASLSVAVDSPGGKSFKAFLQIGGDL